MARLRGLVLLLLTAGAGFRLAAAEPAWVQVRAAEFTLVAQLPEKPAVAWAGEFSQYVAALKRMLPVNTAALPPLTVVIFARDRDFRNFRPLDAAGKPKPMAGFFTRRDGWAVAGMSGTDLDNTRRIIFHEGTHWFMSGFEAPSLVWFEEGMAEVFSTFELTKKGVTWGKPIGEHIRVLNALAPLPIEKLMYLARSDLFAGGDEGMERTGIAYAESWAFVHYLIFGARDGTRREAMIKYVLDRQAGKHPDEAFKESFGAGYAEMDERLREYLHSGNYFTATLAPASVPELRAQPAAAVDVEVALAKLCVAALRYPEALEHARKAVALAGDGPIGHELLGEVYREKGEVKEARAAFEQAIARGSKNFRPYFELAAARHADASTAAGTVENLKPEQAREIANDYERAINFGPQFKRSYQALAGIIGLTPPGNAQDAMFLEQGLKLFPGEPSIRIGLAVLAKREGDHAKARTLLDEVLAGEDALPGHVRTYARRLDAAWQTNDEARQVNALIKEKKYQEALAFVTKSMAATNDSAKRMRLLPLRRNLEATVQAEAIREAWEAKNWTEARRLLEAFQNSDAEPGIKSQMRRRLDELDRRGLGK